MKYLANEHRPTARVLDILDNLAFSQEGYTLTELALKLDAPKSSISPILHTLEDRGYIEINRKTSRYSIGVNTFSAGAIYREKMDFSKFIGSEMRRITNWCNEACVLGVLRGNEVLYIYNTEPVVEEPIHTNKVRGSTEPACICALGKALLCEKRLGQLMALYPEPIQKVAPSTITDISLLHREMEEIRLTKIAYDNNESYTGTYSIAQPIYDKGKIVAAIGIVYPLFRINDDKICVGKRFMRAVVQRLENILDKSDIDPKQLFSLNSNFAD